MVSTKARIFIYRICSQKSASVYLYPINDRIEAFGIGIQLISFFLFLLFLFVLTGGIKRENWLNCTTRENIIEENRRAKKKNVVTNKTANLLKYNVVLD